jgi:hypothetical protein
MEQQELTATVPAAQHNVMCPGRMALLHDIAMRHQNMSHHLILLCPAVQNNHLTTPRGADLQALL